ncbi:hypothetical protein GCM10009733_020150 [Nonomuraea maheshkhaliensis]|uniref:Uncharacterized protein n=1 Tax=Nonomuraea maheshkhaliensis TaxID=419590 RepID=A0ABN2EZA1_9ACTN
MSASTDRAKVINGLRDLADFLETHPDIPISPYKRTVPRVTLFYFAQGTDEQMRTDIDRIASALGTSIRRQDLKAGHYGTSISFGPVTYDAVGILAWARAQYEADRSYSGCITPERNDDSAGTDAFGIRSAPSHKRSLLTWLWPFRVRD